MILAVTRPLRSAKFTIKNSLHNTYSLIFHIIELIKILYIKINLKTQNNNTFNETLVTQSLIFYFMRPILITKT